MPYSVNFVAIFDTPAMPMATIPTMAIGGKKSRPAIVVPPPITDTDEPVMVDILQRR
jgi:hypothetical protein